MIFSKTGTTSYFENRTLEVFPTFSTQSIFDRSFMKGLESYMSDHFYQRDAFMLLNTRKDLMLNVPVINNTVVVDDIILPYFKTNNDTYSQENMDNAIDNIIKLDDLCSMNNAEFLYVGIPEQSSAFSSKYPSYLQNSMYKDNTLSQDFFDSLSKNAINYVDMSSVLKSDPNKFYSTTDHHFNFYGAYECYLGISNYINDNYFSIDTLDISINKVDSDFLGSRNRKLLGLVETDDSLYSYDTSNNAPFTRFDNGQPVTETLFNDSLNNVYNYYMGGDKAETVIKTDRPDLKNALIIGDSFTNPLETLIYNSFNETRSLDFRHTDDIDITEYINTHKPDVVIYIRDDISFINNTGNGNLFK